MIKIALISHTPALAGAERMLYNLARMLQKSPDFEPVVLLPGDENTESAFYKICQETDIPTVWMGARSSYQSWYIYNEIGARTPDKASDILLAERDVKALYLRIKPDVVLINTMTTLVGALAAAEMDIPVVTWVHGVLDNTYLPVNCDAENRLLCDRLLLALSTCAVTCSDWTAAYYKSGCLCPVETVHNWTPELDDVTAESAASFRSDEPDVPTFVCLNTYDIHKGITTLLEAARDLAKQKDCPPFRLEFYGDGAAQVKKKMADYIDQNGLSACVRMCKRTIDISAVYDRAFCLVQPSYMESFGMTIIEAMSKGLPVVSTRCGGPEEIVADGETGYLVARNDPKALAEKMRRLLDRPEQAMKMGRAGKDRFQRLFTESAAAEKMLPLLKKAAREYKGVTAWQRLLADMKNHELMREAGTARLAAGAAGPAGPAQTSVAYDPSELSFSGILKKKRRYGISGGPETLSAVGILVGNMGGPLDKGKLTVQVWQDNGLVTSATLPGSDLNMDGWTWFRFPKVDISDGPLVLEIIPEDMDGLGVFELRDRRGFVYKVFNKLGHPLKGKDVLQTALLP